MGRDRDRSGHWSHGCSGRGVWVGHYWTIGRRAGRAHRAGSHLLGELRDAVSCLDRNDADCAPAVGAHRVRELPPCGRVGLRSDGISGPDPWVVPNRPAKAVRDSAIRNGTKGNCAVVRCRFGCGVRSTLGLRSSHSHRRAHDRGSRLLGTGTAFWRFAVGSS